MDSSCTIGGHVKRAAPLRGSLALGSEFRTGGGRRASEEQRGSVGRYLGISLATVGLTKLKPSHPKHPEIHKTPKSAHKTSQGCTKRFQDAQKRVQDEPKTPQDATRRPQDAPRRHQDATRRPQDAPKTRQDGPRPCFQRFLGETWSPGPSKIKLSLQRGLDF